MKWARGFSNLQLPHSPSGSHPGLRTSRLLRNSISKESNQCSHSVGHQLQRLARVKTQAIEQSAGSENGPLGVADVVLWSRSYWILPQCQHLASSHYTIPG